MVDRPGKGEQGERKEEKGLVLGASQHPGAQLPLLPLLKADCVSTGVIHDLISPTLDPLRSLLLGPTL